MSAVALQLSAAPSLAAAERPLQQATASSRTADRQRVRSWQVIRAQIGQLLATSRLPSSAALTVAAVALTRATAYGDTEQLQVPQEQYRKIAGYAHARQVGAACRELKHAGLASYQPAIKGDPNRPGSGRYGRLTFPHDPVDISVVPPQGNTWHQMSQVVPAYDRSLHMLLSRRGRGRKAALVLYLALLGEAGTWGRTKLELADSSLPISASQAHAGREILRACGWNITPGCGHTGTIYELQPLPNDEDAASEAAAGATMHREDYDRPLSASETVEEVIHFHRVPATKHLRVLCEQISAAGITRTELRRKLSVETSIWPRGAEPAIPYTHRQIRNVADMLSSARDHQPRPASGPSPQDAASRRAHAVESFNRELGQVLWHLDEDELDGLRSYAVEHGIGDPGVVLYRGLNDDLWCKYMVEAYAKREGIDLTEWITDRVAISDFLAGRSPTG